MAGELHFWHTHMDLQQMVDGVNRLIDDINDGKQVIYDIYSEQEKEKGLEMRNTGFPVAMELNKHGYSAFVLNYRVGDYIPGEYKSNEDLIKAAHFILEHAGELEVCPEDYAVGGESAGARIISNVCYGEAGVKRPEELLHPAAYFIIGGRLDR